MGGMRPSFRIAFFRRSSRPLLGHPPADFLGPGIPLPAQACSLSGTT